MGPFSTVTDPHRLILWDVFGTLVLAGPAGRRSIWPLRPSSAAGPPTHAVHMAGKTDPQTAMEIMEALDVAEDDANRHLPAVAFGLERWLDLVVGAYGSDDRDRTVLVPIAIGKAAEKGTATGSAGARCGWWATRLGTLSAPGPAARDACWSERGGTRWTN